ncbi:MAG: ATP-binding protein [Gemmatimonadota bacterium]
MSLLPVAMLRTDTTGLCVELNPAACQLLALPRDRALGLGWLEGLEEGPRRELRDRMERSSPGNPPFAVELLLGQPDGGKTALSCHVLPMAGDDEVTGHWVVLLDVTERQETERVLRRTAQELEERVRELNCLFEVSRAVERSAGDLSAILRETVSILPRSLRFSQAAWARITLEGKSYQSPGYGETPWLMEAPVMVHGEQAGVIQVGYRKGTQPPHLDSFSPEERTLLEAVAQRLGRTAERVTGRRLLQEREEETRQRLTHLTRVSTMGEMASSIAHEVNQPLTAVATYAQACRRMVENGQAGLPEVQHILTRISEEALRAGGIIHRLKDMVRRQESRWTECDVNALIRDVEQLALMDARLENVNLIFQLAPELPPVLADGIQIQQVILNLVRNGIDAVEGVGAGLREVVVQTEMDGRRWIRVAVEDNGCGLPPNAVENLFQPFFTTKKEGMGMGLSISRSIISAHRGRIAFEPNTGPGATFFFTLPILDDE